MTAACTFEGCTVGETGRCALEQNIEDCANRIPGVQLPRADEARKTASDFIGNPVLQAPEATPSFPRSTTLGIEAINHMMASRYVNIVGILGDPESGKTAALASLYLLISTARLDGWTFADSRSLMGFEEITRGTRQWNEGNPPEQMTVHTEMTDERRPGFLHLRLKRTSDGRCVDLALPDIPGEWTKALVRTSQMDRLQFVKAADVIWIVIDGRKLSDKVQRQGAITRLEQLVGRLKTLMDGAELPRLLLVLTHKDDGDISVEVIDRIVAEITKHNLTLSVIPIASFSENAAVKPGTGLSDLINATVFSSVQAPEIWPSSSMSNG